MSPKAELKRAKAAVMLSKRLDAAVKAMTSYQHACLDCGEPGLMQTTAG